MIDSARWLRRFGIAEPDSPRLICFPHAGGAASTFVPLARRLGPGVGVLAAQYPGRQDRSREPCIEDLATLADAFAEALRPLPQTPTVLFGHSMGALVAFEVARRLEREIGRGPDAVVVSGRHAPCTGRPVQVWDEDDLVRELHQLGGTHADVLADEDLRELALHALRGDARAVESYRCEPDATVACRLAAFVGDADPTTSVPDTSAWSRHTTAGFHLNVFPGDHFYMLTALPEVAVALADIVGGRAPWATDRVAV